jgi:hypothetical protein
MLKHVACAAATNSSGLVFPSGSLRSRGPGDGQIDERTAARLDGPRPCAREPSQMTSAVRSALASCTAPFGLTRDLSINLHDASYPQRVPPRHSGFTGHRKGVFGSGRCKRGQCSACA